MRVTGSRAMAGALAAVSAASVLLIGCSSEPAPSGVPTTPVTATPLPEGSTSLPTLVTVTPGDPAPLGYQQRARVEARATLFGVQRNVTAKEGSSAPRTALDIEVCADAPISGISSATWTVIGSDGTEYHPTPGDDAPIVPVYPTKLTALKVDQCLRGWVVIDVPTEAKVTTVRYTPENGAVLLWTVA